MAQLLNLNIKVKNKKLFIEFKPSSDVSYLIETTISNLKRHYKIDIEDICPSFVRTLIKDDIIPFVTITNYDSKVITRKNIRRTFKFQIEDNLVLITELSTKKEIFCQLNQIKNFDKFEAQDFEEILSKKQKITPTRSNIQTNELDFNLFE